MRHRTKILVLAAGVTALVLFGWLAVPSLIRVNAVALVIATNAPSRQSFFTAFLTNTTASVLRLDPLLVQLEDDQGKVLNNLGENWIDTEGNQVFTLRSRGVACVSPQADPTHKRVRVVVEYSCTAGMLPRVLSRGIRRTPLARRPGGLRVWLMKRGFIDGEQHGRVESPWLLNPASAAALAPAVAPGAAGSP